MNIFKRELTAAQTVKLAREDRYTARQLIDGIVSDFFELHGDRQSYDDPSIIGGIGFLGETPVTIIGIDKGLEFAEKVQKHNGSPLPSGYRKAQRLMAQAAKFNRPIITLINTPGAYPGKEAEEMGQGQAIAESILQSMQLPVPVIAIVYGEGGSGGALALATANEVWMFEHATYSVLSPEGFAAILWKDASRSDEAAELLGLTPKDLLSNGVIEKVIPDQKRFDRLAGMLRTELVNTLTKYHNLNGDSLIAQRMERFNKF
ncbi:acetyl-CoA carboxylase carboxyltransferase subunit alpha [Periweissella fabalis]|uniref:acetyl-CoA carboxytransferase n=1 Tax=Periweissella fabalis TaxID=1070421 RepID=A0A7X6N2M0_9LACO|nr:carboxyltransferase subunit alpha [Periweissella fabalis]MCM0598559.1 acetyl-CoA carboxylase carboxyl transferase subunit alpha [Periweissella fabalis]NKZ24159.1 acetyl-CoA carboxylase carboxyl transferase subunit alpha [Periweissella fabalis]